MTDYGKILKTAEGLAALLSGEQRIATVRTVLDFIEADIRLRLDESQATDDPDEAPEEETGTPPIEIVKRWNALTESPIAKAGRLTEGRARKIRTRLKRYPELEAWDTVFRWLNTQDWCTGRTDRGWVVSLNWLIENDDRLQGLYEQATAPQPEGKADVLDALDGHATEDRVRAVFDEAMARS